MNERGFLYTDAPDKQGLQRFAYWLTPGTLPRKVTPTDIDFCLHNRDGDRFLFIEFKPNMTLNAGQRQMLIALERKGMDVWVVTEPKDDVVTRWVVPQVGLVYNQAWHEMTLVELALAVKDWWNGAS